jgi:rod shape-determining protein MreD
MKLWLIIRTLFSGFVILYLQVLVAPRLAIAGITPNFFLGWIVYEVWRKPVNVLIPIIFLLGLCYDLTMPTLLGLQTSLFILLAVGVDEFHRPLEKDSFITMGITLGLACFTYSILMYIAFGIQSGFSFHLLLMILGLLAYNLVASALISIVLVSVSHLKLDFRHE